ncbi:MAG: 1-deoxy-D-xylulose-5-phosphate synthase [Clostridia bacterium]|nr:1-deoxy-D-xylulose-5-phosphate synthase [Clostridia bacterium]
MLDKVNNPEDLKKLNIKEKEQLAKEIREKVINTVSVTGGHLASNLGVTEITIALHSVFNTPKDKIVWDVGHQTYVHKILTGRKDKMHTLRQLGGISGFPKIKESEYDSFDTGHSSTSISVALGMARARDIKKEDNNVIAIIGDGALTGGMALEALNDAGNSKTKLIVILNDNEMSISKNVGGISQFLTKMRTRKFYKKSNNSIRKALEKAPKIGTPIIRVARRIKYSLKQLVLPNMFFEDLGFKYLGPVDGHDIERIEWILKLAKKEQEPVLVHIITKKGKGYKPAEENPDKFHATGSFEIETGKSKKEKKKDYSTVFGEKLVDLAKNNEKIVAITAAMTDGTGLKEFKEKYPNRFFDVGIAEQHAVSLAAGLAKEGLKPVVPIYSSFYQRAYDQVIHDICIESLPVVLCVDRAGVVGNDGETHQGLLDLAFFNLVPNLSIMAPKDFKELEKMLEYAITLNSPVVIRYPRGGESEKVKFEKHEEINRGKAEILKEGKDISIITIGKMVVKGMEIAQELEKQGKSVELINARFLKPFDKETIIETITKTKNVITIEDASIIGGLATKVKEVIAENKLENVELKCYAYPDKFIEAGNVGELEEKYLF